MIFLTVCVCVCVCVCVLVFILLGVLQAFWICNLVSIIDWRCIWTLFQIFLLLCSAYFWYFNVKYCKRLEIAQWFLNVLYLCEFFPMLSSLCISVWEIVINISSSSIICFPHPCPFDWWVYQRDAFFYFLLIKFVYF